MELFQGIMSRKSCRAYKSTPILTDVMNRVLEAACRSPSYTNTQPWDVAVVRGDKTRELSLILCGLAESGAPISADIPLPTAWPPDLDQRSREHGARRFKALGVERESEAQRKELRMMNYRFYGAPSVIFIFIDSSLTTWSVFDAGLFAQTLCLAAHSVGLGTCLQASLAWYPDAVRQFLGYPQTKRLVTGLSIGYPDPDARINAYVSTRAGLSEFVRHYG